MGAEAEVLNSLAGVLRATKEKRVGSSRRTESQLVQSHGLTSSLLDSGSGSSGEAQSSNGQLRDVKKAVVIRDAADDDDSLALVGFGHVRRKTRERNRRAVDSRHKESTQHNLVEVRIRAAYEVNISLVSSSPRVAVE